MSELLALARLIWAKNRYYLIGFALAILIIDVVYSTYYFHVKGEFSLKHLAVGLFMVYLPAYLWGMFMLDFSQQAEFGTQKAGFNHFLLRMPIADWKLALIPIVAKTLWAFLLWTPVYLIFRAEEPHLQYFAPAICQAAVGVWVSAVFWRPYRFVLLQGFVVIAFLILAYASIVIVISAPVNSRIDRFWLDLFFVPSVLSYMIGAKLAFRAIPIARSHVQGMIPADQRKVAKSIFDFISRDHHRNCPERSFSNASFALAWHDLLKSRNQRVGTILFICIPVFLLYFFTPLMTKHPGLNIALGFYLLFFWGALPWLNVLEPTTHETRPSLPPYLAAAPLSDSRIAWTRLATVTALMVCGIFIGLSLILSVFVWPSMQEAWYRWASNLASYETVKGTPIVVGMRSSIALVVATILIAARFLIGNFWTSLCGRTWPMMSIVVLYSLVAGGLFVWAFRWFTKHTEWEHVQRDFSVGLTYVPMILGGMLACKAIFSLASLIAVWRSNIVSRSESINVVLIWCLATLCFGSILYALIPDSRMSWIMCLLATAYLIPIGRFLPLPMAVHYNRHR